MARLFPRHYQGGINVGDAFEASGSIAAMADPALAVAAGKNGTSRVPRGSRNFFMYKQKLCTNKTT